MSPLDVLKNPDAAPSSCWHALEALFGAGIRAWEPETLHLELERRGIEWDDALSAKVMGAQTVLTTRAWSHDHSVFFAFALACEGQPAGGVAHPTAAQMAWAVTEIEALTEGKIDEDIGFDPDGVDPAIAVVLHDDGWVLTPDELRFCQLALSNLDQGDETLRARVMTVWSVIKPLTDEAIHAVCKKAPEDDVGVQVTRLACCELELRERSRLRAQHHVTRT